MSPTIRTVGYGLYCTVVDRHPSYVCIFKTIQIVVLMTDREKDEKSEIVIIVKSL